MKFSMPIHYMLSAVVILALTGCAGESDTVPVVLDGVIDIGTYENNDVNTGISSDPGSTTGTGTVSPATNTTGVVTLSWMPPTENTDSTALTDLGSYKIYYGLTPTSLSSTIVINNTGLTSYVIENLNTNTTYYFAITAINNSNAESVYSNIESKYISG